MHENPRLQLSPTQHLETRPVLAGAYRGADERTYLTHAIVVEADGSELRVLCRQPLDHIADYYSVSDAERRAPPTCARCLERWEKLQMQTNPRKRAPAMQLGQDDSNREREASGGRFRRSPACDFCGKSCAAEHYSDDRACGGGDGPGFYLCGRAACRSARARLEVDQGFDALVRHYAEQRRKNIAAADKPRPFLDGPRGTDRQLAKYRREQDLVAAQISRASTQGREEAVKRLQERERELQRLVDKLAFGHTPNGGYYVWVLASDGAPKDEGPYGPKPLEEAKQFARIAATNGAHDRAVSRGLDPQSPSFEVVRRYQRGTGERVL